MTGRGGQFIRKDGGKKNGQAQKIELFRAWWKKDKIQGKIASWRTQGPAKQKGRLGPRGEKVKLGDELKTRSKISRRNPGSAHGKKLELGTCGVSVKKEKKTQKTKE